MGDTLKRRIRTTQNSRKVSNVERSPGGQQSNSTAECQRKERRINMFNDEVKPKLELISLFPIPLVKTNIGRSFTKKEIDCFVNIPMYKTHTNQAGFQSESFKIFDNFAIELKDIKTFCEQELKRYLEDIEGVDTNITNLNITTSWLNKLEPQGFHVMHNHRNSYLSGILYIRCLPNDNIQFTNLHRMCDTMLEFPRKKITKFNTEGALVNIKEGDFIIFPAQTLHQVGVNETKDQDRMSLSFDTWPILWDDFPELNLKTRRLQKKREGS